METYTSIKQSRPPFGRLNESSPFVVSRIVYGRTRTFCIFWVYWGYLTLTLDHTYDYARENGLKRYRLILVMVTSQNYEKISKHIV